MNPSSRLQNPTSHLLIWIASLICLAPLINAAERPGHYGISLAYPSVVPQTFPRQGEHRYFHESIASLTLTVDSTGLVTDITGPATFDSLFFGMFGPTLDSLRFTPGLVDGLPAEQKIPIRFRFSTLRQRFSFQFPVDTSMVVSDPDLYFRAIELNGVNLPGIDYFPSYFYKFSPTDTPGVCPYVLAKVKLDSTGNVEAVEALNDGSPAFTSQLLTAANWAKYHAARVGGKPVGGDVFLVVTFLPGVVYPTRPLIVVSDTVELRDRVRVRLYPDTVGWMIKPLAVNPGYDDVYVAGGEKVRPFDTAMASIRIDTLGTCSFLGVSGCSSKTYDILGALLSNLRFASATDFSGVAGEWEGLLRIGYVDSTRIRIDYPWFPTP